MPGDPPDIRRTEINVPRLILKDIDKTIIRINHIAPAGMNYPFGLPRRPGSIEDEQHVLRIHFFGRTIRITLLLYFEDLILPPNIPTLDHADRNPGPH